MIEHELARLDDRAGGRRAIGMGPLNRDDLLRWSGATLLDILRARFPIRGRRVRCVVLDERDVGISMLGPTLQTTLANDVERIEFLFRGAMPIAPLSLPIRRKRLTLFRKVLDDSPHGAHLLLSC